MITRRGVSLGNIAYSMRLYFRYTKASTKTAGWINLNLIDGWLGV